MLDIFCGSRHRSCEDQYRCQSGETVSSSDQSTVEYEGATYRYNDHLSNYLFMGIDSTEEVSEMESQLDAGQADSIYLVSLDRATEQVQVLSIPRDTITEIEVLTRQE